MTKYLLIAVAALCLSCSDRAAEQQALRQSFKEYIVTDSVNLGVCIDAIDFANWVKKAHPDIWIEYYNTAIGDTL